MHGSGVSHRRHGHYRLRSDVMMMVVEMMVGLHRVLVMGKPEPVVRVGQAVDLVSDGYREAR